MPAVRVQIDHDPFAGRPENGRWYTRGIWPCAWVSCPGAEAPPHVAVYRRAFTLHEPAQSRIHVSADERYDLFLDGERSLLRKGQEFAITFMLEACLSKQRILEIYLNNVEWGEGVFGAQAAAQHYFRTNAATLGPAQAARLAVMLPAPKRFEKSPSSPYVLGRSATIAARMGGVDLP